MCDSSANISNDSLRLPEFPEFPEFCFTDVAKVGTPTWFPAKETRAQQVFIEGFP